VYHKSRFVYHLHRAKHEIRAKDAVIVMEGYMDVITAYQAGIKNVVASSGTALTREQIHLLGRYTKNIFFAFDTDAAGKEATKRAVIPALAADMRARVVLTRGGKDPDEAIRKDRDAFLHAVESAPAFMDYFCDTLASTYDPSTVDGKKQYAQEILSLLVHLPDMVEQQHYLQALAERVHVDERILYEKFIHFAARANTVAGSTPQTSSVIPSAQISAQSQLLRTPNVLLERLFACIFAFPKTFPFIIDHLDPEWMRVGVFQELYKRLIIYYTHHQDVQWKQIVDNVLTPEDTERFSRMIVESQELLLQDERVIMLEIEQIIARLHRNYILEQLTSLKQDIAAAEQRRETQKLSELTHLLRDYTQKLHQLS